jgi:hypothetical protein
MIGPVYRISNVADVSKIPVELDPEQFGEQFEIIFGDTDVAVDSLISTVFKFTRHVPSMEKSFPTAGRWRRLF